MVMLRGPSRVAAARALAIPKALKFKSQRKLNLPLAILDLLRDPPAARRFQERCDVRGTAGRRTGENLGVEMLTTKVWMVHDVEEFGTELHHAGLSQESQLCILHHRKIPSPFG